MAAFAGASPAAAILSGARVAPPSLLPPPPPSSSIQLPRRPLSTGPTSRQLISDACRFPSLRVRASSSEETPGAVQVDDLVSDLKEKWDAIENKSTVFLYGGGAIVAVWLSSTLVGAINSVPLLPKIMELVGLGYTGWFVYRYLLFKSSRQELARDIEDLKKKIAGSE
ncbi:protein CURVATURE THYLAKOID 1A, chloroplastic-like [Iris pallida]|uniref:Protein CURVATURE THYLAKOID 1A, chloroplastic-like n=1 Tax=Iris pallida TaxID=29817 RepID=A0AAX6GGM3_IRIPA|nr:protein CURVATURE THYLAKOID 1A, chloroplastic-like [Iris pallida]KAJ6827458.1 protein CURVATURE THYLAKOID 1A, chloroplastic-like [Iris pallida]